MPAEPDICKQHPDQHPEVRSVSCVHRPGPTRSSPSSARNNARAAPDVSRVESALSTQYSVLSTSPVPRRCLAALKRQLATAVRIHPMPSQFTAAVHLTEIDLPASTKTGPSTGTVPHLLFADCGDRFSQGVGKSTSVWPTTCVARGGPACMRVSIAHNPLI